jgi:Sigma-70 region 2
VESVTKAGVSTLEDRDLVVRVVDGDVRAFEALYDRYSAHVFGLAMRVTGRQRAAEEATQDTFLSLWRTADRYDTHRGTLKTWLLSMVRNRSIDWLRREARHDRDLEIDDALVGRLEAAERTEEQAASREESRHARPADQPSDRTTPSDRAGVLQGADPHRNRGQGRNPAWHGQGQTTPRTHEMHEKLTSLPEIALSK